MSQNLRGVSVRRLPEPRLPIKEGEGGELLSSAQNKASVRPLVPITELMDDVFEREIELVLVVLTIAAVLSAKIVMYPQERDLLLLKERNDVIVQRACRSQRVFSIVQLCVSNTRIDVDERLLVNSPDALEFDAVLNCRLLARDILESCFPAIVVKLFEAIETVF